MANERQRIAFSVTPNGGTFTLTFDGDDTSAIAYDADSATVLAALEALSSIGSGNIQVDAWDGVTLDVQFIGALANTNVDQMTCTSASLTQAAGNPTVSEITGGVAGVNETQVITLSAIPYGGSWTINGITVTDGHAADSGDVEAAIENGGGANEACGVSGDFDDGFTVTYTDEENISDSLLDIDVSLLEGSTGDPTIATVQDGDGGSNPEIQTITLAGGPTAGFWKISTEVLAFDESQASAETKIKNLILAIDTVTRSGSGTAGDPYVYTLTWTGVSNEQPAGGNPVTVDPSDPIRKAGNITADVDTTGQGVAPVTEVQRVTLPAGTNGGTFTLNNGSGDSTSIAYNEADAGVEAAVDTIFACTVTGTGPPWDIEWDVAAPRDMLTVTNNTLTKGGVTDTESTLQEGSASGVPFPWYYWQMFSHPIGAGSGGH